jgi:nicotinamidase-related amidase
VITGAETDVCVLSTVLNAVDLGFRVVIVEDALCSSSDVGHDALMTSTVAVSTVRSIWSPPRS